MKYLILLFFAINIAFGASIGAVYVNEHAYSIDANHAQTVETKGLEILRSSGFEARIAISDEAPAAFSILSASGYISVANDNIFEEAHGLVTGASLAITTSDTLPAGLSAVGYVYVENDDFFQVMASHAAAIAGTPAIDITTVGVGTQTFTPTTTGGTTLLQKSLDNVNWETLATYNGTGTSTYEDTSAYYNYVRISSTATGGILGLDIDINHK